MAKPRYSWTQPICQRCYTERYPGREPSRLVEAGREVCVQCGEPTQSGIYVRIDPATAPHPSRRKQDAA